MSVSVDSLVKIAKAEIGYKEGTNNDTKYGVWFGWNHVAWCAIFVSWVFAQSGAAGKILKTAGCIELNAWAVKNNLIVPTSQIRAGDVILFDFTKSGKAEHVGIATGIIDKTTHLFPTVEGNTGADHIGVNQANGDGVYGKVRATSIVHAVIRPNL